MPTKPYEPLFNRDIHKVTLKPYIDLASQLLQEAVNYATNLYHRCVESKEADGDESYPVLASYLHIIQMTDSIEVLLSGGGCAPSNLLLRSAFEGKLTILYILQRQYKIRAYSWLYKNILDQIESYKTYDPNRNKGKRFIDNFKKQGLDQIAEPLAIPDISERINKLENTLKKPEYTEIFNEYKRLEKAKGKRKPEWYSLYNGPTNLRELAEHLNQGVTYQTLYTSTSRIAHMSSADHLTFHFEDGRSALGPIRNPMYIVGTPMTALSIILKASEAMIKKYINAEITSFRQWNTSEIQERCIALMNMDIGHLKWFEEKFVNNR